MSAVVAEIEDVSSDEALAPGTTLLNAQYKIDRYLSAGGFGITYLAHDSLQRQVVIKECFPEAVCSRRQKAVCARSRAHQGDFRSFVTLFVREARSLSKLNHPNVVGVHQVFEDNETAYMALDLIDGDDLLSIIEDPNRSFNPDEIREILLKILNAISLIHSQDILHRDVSPDNILIDKSGEPILIDFGAAREEASKKSRALSSVLVVKDGYSPQEFYFGGSRQGPYSDIYALGATFYHLISGESPPHSQTRLSEIAGKNPDPCEPLSGRFPIFNLSFLASIDKAMSVFPKDRFQSATDWSNWIDKNGANSVDAERLRANEQSIKSLMSNLPRHVSTAEKPIKPVTSNSSTAPATAPAKYSLDLSDIQIQQGQKVQDMHSKEPAKMHAGHRIRRPKTRLLATVVLFSMVALQTTWPAPSFVSEMRILGPSTQQFQADNPQRNQL